MRQLSDGQLTKGNEMKKTYYQLKRMTARELFDYAVKADILSLYDKKFLSDMPIKSVLLEILSVTHRDWVKTPFINGNKKLITQ
jgi:hypothetical protein